MPQTGTVEVLPGRSGRTSPQDRVYLAMLLDFYGELLSPRQRECCDLYFNEDLSLSEIAETCGISRQGAWDQYPPRLGSPGGDRDQNRAASPAGGDG